MNFNKKLVRTAIATTIFSLGSKHAMSEEAAAATEPQAATPQAEQKPVVESNASTAKAAATPASAAVVSADVSQPKNNEDFENKVLATVDGQPITGSMLGAYLAGRTSKMRGMKPPPQMQGVVLNNLISITLLAKAAREAGIDTRPGMAMSLNLQRDQLLAQTLLQEYASTNAPSEEALKKAYDEKYAKQNQEYKASHVLVKTEDEAKKVVEQLGKGTDFATVAKEKSIDPSSSKGGDLGWFDASQMVKPFSDAVAAMKIGTTSTAPVQSQFGWHVIKLEDKRATTPPDFNSVRPRLLSEIQRTVLTEYVDKLRSKAKIEMKELLTPPQPPVVAPPAEAAKK